MSVSLDAKLNSPPSQKHLFTSKVKSSARAAKPFFKIFFITLALLRDLSLIQTPNASGPPPLGSLNATITTFSVPSSIKEILKHAKKKGLKGSVAVENNLRIAAAIANLACGILGSIKMVETFWVAIENLSNSLGPVKVAFTALAPVTVAFAGIEIVKTTIDIGIDAVHIHQTNDKIRILKAKKKLWGSIDWKDGSAAPIITNKIDQLKAKQLTSIEDLSLLEGAVKTSALALNQHALKWEKKKEKITAKKLALSDKNIAIRFFGGIVPKIKATQTKSKYKIALKEHTGNINKFIHLTEKYNKRAVKIKNWKIIESKMKDGTLTHKDQILLKKFQSDQLSKWRTKRSNYNLEKLKIGLGIALKTVVIISLIASIVLTFTGYGTIPGIVTMASLSLFIVAAEYGLKKFKKHKKPAEWKPGSVPKLI